MLFDDDTYPELPFPERNLLSIICYLKWNILVSGFWSEMERLWDESSELFFFNANFSGFGGGIYLDFGIYCFFVRFVICE